MAGPLSPAARTQAIAAFESLGLCQQLAEAAADLGWKSPSAVQQQAVPLLIQGRSSIAALLGLRMLVCSAKWATPPTQADQAGAYHSKGREWPG